MSELIDDSLRSSNAIQSVIGLRVMPPLSMRNDLARSRRSNAAGDVQHILVRDSATQRSESYQMSIDEASNIPPLIALPVEIKLLIISSYWEYATNADHGIAENPNHLEILDCEA